MLHLADLPVLVLIALVAALTLWALIDCIRTPRERVRFLPKLLWLLILLHGSVCAALLWTYFGKKPIADTAKGPIQRIEPFAQAR
ncbi:PLDc N-terminal domain-containing protein [Streptomyces sp. DSM 15324]|uniref:PLDc N-terminal domain-containing protein n=1 Tax=Streptomyces sp. DSM 15324 TaxID=1739111 RepID=UPI00082EF8E7|nr:PLDc N-terminal domain-containing protein [Streptomyces sp. DSM 15324]